MKCSISEKDDNDPDYREVRASFDGRDVPLKENSFSRYSIPE